MNYITDEKLFEDVQRGNRQSMELIVHRYYQNIFKYIYNRVKDYYAAQDLCQECFSKIYEKRRTYSDRYPLKAWIYKIAYNSTIDYYRSKAYKENRHMEITDNLIEHKNIIEHKLFKNNIDDMLDGLNENQREILNLRFKGELSIKDIALTVNSNENTVKSRLYSALKILKKSMQKENGGEGIEKVVK